MISLPLRRQELIINEHGNHDWRVMEHKETLEPQRVAIILCDVWNYHYCTGAMKRIDAMMPKMNRVLHAARNRGMVIIHAPATLMDAYRDTPARDRALALPPASVPEPSVRDVPPLPVSRVTGTCCDTPGCAVESHGRTHQHDGIDIDHQCDYILEEGERCHAVLQHHKIARALIVGFFANVCVFNRPFGVKAMTMRGVQTAVVRDLTDAMYNPATWPYVSHKQGTQLVLGYYEKFWCPTIDSDAIIDNGALQTP